MARRDKGNEAGWAKTLHVIIALRGCVAVNNAERVNRSRTVPWDLPAADIEDALARSGPDLESWRDARFLVTGGTGFLGSWITATLLEANLQLGLGLRIELLTRKPADVPSMPDHDLSILAGDVRSLPRIGHVDLIVHGAASSSAAFGRGDGDPYQMASTIVDGTRAVLDVARRSGSSMLFLSSGAVYGRQTSPAVVEEHSGGPDSMDPRSAYAESKRLAETLCAAVTSNGQAKIVVGRLFSFVGPRLPLDAHFAAGNFLSDALAGRPVRVAGDGRTVRSYLYAGELPEWCFALLARGVPGRAYNVGSSEAVTIAELANLAAGLVSPALPVLIDGVPSTAQPDRYVPSVLRAERELQLKPQVSLRSSLERSFNWFARHPR